MCIRDSVEHVLRRSFDIEKPNVSFSTLLLYKHLLQSSEVLPNILVPDYVGERTNDSMCEVDRPNSIDDGRIQGLKLINENVREDNPGFVATQIERLLSGQILPSDSLGICLLYTSRCV